MRYSRFNVVFYFCFTQALPYGKLQKHLPLNVTLNVLLSGQPAPAYVGFTASVGVYNLTNIGSMQTIVFDSVVSNVGYGYDRATGIFRAPTA